MNVKEARAEFILTMEDACIESCEHNSKDSAEHNITIAADAYALAVHVAACEKQNETPDLPPKTPTQDYKCPDGSHHSMTHNWGPGDIRELYECSKCGALNESVMMRRQASKAKPQRCGDGWYCDVAKELGK